MPLSLTLVCVPCPPPPCQAKIRMEASAVSSGNAYASASLASRYSLSAHVGELTGGLSQLTTIKAALKQVSSRLRSLMQP